MRVSALTALVFVISMSSVDNASAAPFTSYLDDLIVELESRSAALEGSLIKEEIKLKKGIDKILKKFVKDSSGPDKDLKNVAKAAKSLTKLFPEEMNPGKGGGDGNTLYDLVEAALASFDGDIQALLVAAQGVVDGAPIGKCRDKAQAVLDDVNAQLAALPGLPTLPDVAKALGKALKSVFKGQKLAVKALGCVPKLKWWQSTGTATVEGTPYVFYVEANEPEMGELSFTLNGSFMFAGMRTADSMLEILMQGDVASGVTSALGGTVTYGKGFYLIDPINSTVTMGNIPGLPGRVTATFALQAVGSLGTVGTISITGGSFSMWGYPF
jgi:hypothetical protein